MNKYRPIVAFLLTFLIVLGITFSQSPLAATAQEGSTNHIFIDVTYDPNAKTYSLGGFTEAQLKQALSTQGKQPRFLGQIFVDHGWVTQDQVAQALADQRGLCALQPGGLHQGQT